MWFSRCDSLKVRVLSRMIRVLLLIWVRVLKLLLVWVWCWVGV